jgi:hypothetical protein
VKNFMAQRVAQHGPSGLRTAFFVALLMGLHSVHAQSSCASDGQPKPVQLVERFINADCESCWRDAATPEAAKNETVLDWVLPGGRGEDAPLSAVASRDGLGRLDALRKTAPAESMWATGAVMPATGASLRVAHGIALSGYIGTSIELMLMPAALKNQRLSAWLALVEAIPSGTEGTPIDRYLVRNVLSVPWNTSRQPASAKAKRFFESRSMSVAQGVNADRLTVIGWVEDASGGLVAAAQSRCPPVAN